jgi:hypothetical protein
MKKIVHATVKILIAVQKIRNIAENESCDFVIISSLTNAYILWQLNAASSKATSETPIPNPENKTATW